MKALLKSFWFWAAVLMAVIAFAVFYDDKVRALWARVTGSSTSAPLAGNGQQSGISTWYDANVKPRVGSAPEQPSDQPVYG